MDPLNTKMHSLCFDSLKPKLQSLLGGDYSRIKVNRARQVWVG